MADGSSIPPAAPLDQLIDEAPLGQLHIGIVAVAFGVMFLEGVDIQLIGFAAPSIIREWRLEPAAFGVVFSAGLAGATLGAAILGPIGDRLGRKPLILWSIVVFGIGTLATTLTHDINTMVVIRFLASLGLGGVIPNLLALVAEFAPHRLRATFVSIVATGQLAGGMIGALVSSALIVSVGWPSLFVFAGVISIALLLPVWLILPESIRFMALLPGSGPRIRRILQKISPGVFRDVDPVLPPPEPPVPITALLQSRLAPLTLLLWLAVAANLFMTSFVIYWLPTLLEQGGMNLSTAIQCVSVMNGAGLLGGLVVARLLGRWRPGNVLALFFAIGAVSVAAIGHVMPMALPVLLTVAVAGFTGLGAYMGINALSSSLYPTPLRSAGIGWAIAAGKIGSLLGPTAATGALVIGVSQTHVFLVSASGGIVAAISLLALGHITHTTQQ